MRDHMTDREFIVWLSGYIDARPEAVDPTVKSQLDAQVIRGIKQKMLEAAMPSKNEDLAWDAVKQMRSVGSSMGYSPMGPTTGQTTNKIVPGDLGVLKVE